MFDGSSDWKNQPSVANFVSHFHEENLFANGQEGHDAANDCVRTLRGQPKKKRSDKRNKNWINAAQNTITVTEQHMEHKGNSQWSLRVMATMSKASVELPPSSLTNLNDSLLQICCCSDIVGFHSQLLLQKIKEALNGAINRMTRSPEDWPVLVVVHQWTNQWILMASEVVTNECMGIVHSTNNATLTQLIDDRVWKIVVIHDTCSRAKGHINPTTSNRASTNGGSECELFAVVVLSFFFAPCTDTSLAMSSIGCLNKDSGFVPANDSDSTCSRDSTLTDIIPKQMPIDQVDGE